MAKGSKKRSKKGKLDEQEIVRKLRKQVDQHLNNFHHYDSFYFCITVFSINFVHNPRMLPDINW